MKLSSRCLKFVDSILQSPFVDEENAKRQDGRRLSTSWILNESRMPLTWSVDKENVQYLLQNAKLLEKNSFVSWTWSLHEIISLRCSYFKSP